MTWTNLPNVPSEAAIARTGAFLERLGEPANDPAVRTEGMGVWVEDGGGCIEPGGFELERTVEPVPCPNPRCGARAERLWEERAEGSLNIYEWVECQACGYQKGDIPDDRWWPVVLDEDEAARWHGVKQAVAEELHTMRHRASHDARVLQAAYARLRAQAGKPLTP